MLGLLSLRWLCLLVVGVAAEPAPARVPKVYNALITSNQNLEPSKAYPVYQPVLHDTAFAFPFQPAVFYGGDFPIGNGLIPAPAFLPKEPSVTQQPPAASADPQGDEKSASTEIPLPTPQPTSSEGDSNENSAPAQPLPPSTESPIPLNEFGLPQQVLPLGRLNPAYDGFTQIGPFSYTYPGFRFYDPYDPFSLSPYGSLPPLYRPLPNVLGQVPFVAGSAPLPPPVQATAPPAPSSQGSPQAPPPEPNDLTVLNYSTKDPAIPDVPPPPLPQGGLKSDKSE